MIAQQAPGAEIILPARHPFAVDSLYGLARANRIRVGSFDGESIKTHRPLKDAIVDHQFDENAGKPWTLAIACSDNPSGKYVAAGEGAQWCLIDWELLDDASQLAIK